MNEWLGQEKSLAVFVQHNVAWMLLLGNVLMGTRGITPFIFAQSSLSNMSNEDGSEALSNFSCIEPRN